MSSTKTLFLDSNVIYNLMQNKPNAHDLLEAINDFDFTYILSLSEFFASSFCIFTKANGGEDYSASLKALLDNKRTSPVCIELNRQIIQHGRQILKDKDFEDACQVSAAVLNNCDAILTSDKAMADNYKHLIKIIFVPRK